MRRVIGKITKSGYVGEPSTPADAERLADMLASHQAPMAVTDREFMRFNCNGAQFEGLPAYGAMCKAEAEKAGVSTTGKKYMSQLARFTGDPEAWVSGRGDVERVCKARQWNCEGSVNVDSPIRDEPAKPKLADDLVQKYVKADLAENPEQRIGDVVEKVKKRYSGAGYE